MTTYARCRVEPVSTAGPHHVVRLVGVLDRTQVEAVRRTLLTFLADRPVPTAVDLTALGVPALDPVVLGALTAADGQAAQWPAGRLVFFYVPDPASRDRAVGGLDGLLSAGLPEAVSTLDGRDGRSSTLSLDLQPAVGAARLARELVTEGCARWDLPQVLGSACIAVTELANNVVAHARTPMTVWVGRRDGELRVAVRDGSSHLPTFGGAVAATATGGRGLLLIDTVSRRWGATPLDDGKLVWAALHPDDEEEAYD